MFLYLIKLTVAQLFVVLEHSSLTYNHLSAVEIASRFLHLTVFSRFGEV